MLDLDGLWLFELERGRRDEFTPLVVGVDSYVTARLGVVIAVLNPLVGLLLHSLLVLGIQTG